MFEWPIAVDDWETQFGKVFSSGERREDALFLLDFNALPLPPQGKTWRLEDVIAKLNEKYGTQLLVNFFVGTDDKDSSAFIIHVGVGLQLESLVLLCFFLFLFFFTPPVSHKRTRIKSIQPDRESPANVSKL